MPEVQTKCGDRQARRLGLGSLVHTRYMGHLRAPQGTSAVLIPEHNRTGKAQALPVATSSEPLWGGGPYSAYLDYDERLHLHVGLPNPQPAHAPRPA